MGNEVSRPAEDLSPQNSGVVPPRSPYTPTGGSSRRAQSFNARSPSPSTGSNVAPQQRRTSSSSSLGSNPTSNPKKERTIQRMDKAIRRRVRGGITYNMKLLIRGAKGTGKTSLFHRLKGEPIPETHQSTPQLQSATINWSFRQNLEENVKCEVWDVVDKGFIPVEAQEGGEEGPNVSQHATAGVSAEHGGLQSGGSLSAEATAAAAAAAAAIQNGTHSVAIVDASTVDVYHEAHGVIFLLDITKWDSQEYVKQQLDNVPVHIPTLVLGNFRDQGAQRKIFKEDIQELLYGSSGRPQHQQWRRPIELLYFECSLLNCYGLKSLHQYFGIPFLQLKLATIRQQMRIVEGEFAHLKHDVQATISEQRYADYVEHIKATGSDIRTGRRGSGNGNTPPSVSRNNSVRLSPREKSDTKQDGADDDVSVVRKESGAGTPRNPNTDLFTGATVGAEKSQQEKGMDQTQDMEDLPSRNSSAVIQSAPRLVFEHKESVASIPDDVVVEDKAAHIEDDSAPPEDLSGKLREANNASLTRHRKASVEEVMHLEDFQVPKARISDLDHFYSEDESDEDVGDNDEDVVVAPVNGSMKATISGVYHKQRFLDSDSSDSDESTSVETQRRRKEKAPRKSSPRRTAMKQTSSTGQAVPRPPQSSPSPPSPHPPAAPSRMKQRSRPGSPARSQPNSPVKDSKDGSCEISPKQRQATSSISYGAGAVPPKPPTAMPTSPSIRHSNPRNKSETSVAVVSAETRASLLQDESDTKNESFSGEEPELTSTEVATERIGEKEFRKNSMIDADGDDVVSPPINTDASDSIAPHETELPGMDKDVSRSGTLRNSINDEPEDVARISAFEQAYNPIKTGPEGVSVADTNELEVGLGASSNELNSFLADDDDGDGDEDNTLQDDAVKAEETIEPQLSTSSHHRPEVLVSAGESDSDTDDPDGPAEISSSSLQASLPIPERSASSVLSFAPVSSALMGTVNQGQEQTKGHYHKRNHDEAGDLLSLSALQASLPLPGEASVSVPPTMPESTAAAGYSNDSNGSRTSAKDLQLSDLQTTPSNAAVKPVVPEFASVVPSNDLEAFLNESDSDSDEAPPPSYSEPAAGKKQINRRPTVESSDNEDDEKDEDRFASYSISKKKRSERRRQQQEDLRQLNAALDMKNDPFAPSTSGIAASDSSFGTSDVMEAIRKAQEEAMRMLPTEPAPADDTADSSSSKKMHKHKHKKEHKHKKAEGDEKLSRKSSRKSGSSSRSKKRRPHVEDDHM